MIALASGLLALTPLLGLAQDADRPLVPLYDNLGDLSYPITTEVPLTQRYFDQGLRWAYGFNHSEAQLAFQAAQHHDPDCAMCYWGEALVLGPNINAPMPPEAVAPALEAIEQAQALADGVTEVEKALIQALGERYVADPQADRAPLDAAYADAMMQVHEQFPADHTVAVLAAEAIMDTSPWDYWEADGLTPKGRIQEAIQVVEAVLADNPDHPQAIHLYIHLTEASADPGRAEPYADRLGNLMPGAGHLVHMPSHTYYRLGRFQDSVSANIDASAADEAYLATAQAPGPMYNFGYYPHNLHFVVTSSQMIGDADTALSYADRLHASIPDEVAKEVGMAQPMKAGSYYAYAQLGEPSAVLAMDRPSDELPFLQGVWHYARGMAQVKLEELEEAREESAKLADITSNTDFTTLEQWMVPAGKILRTARHVLEGNIAMADDDPARAVEEFRVAEEIQDSMAYMEPPYWYYPVGQSVGAALLADGKPAEAAAAFQASLEKQPNNGWALFGLARAREAMGDTEGAAEADARFRENWAGAALDLGRL
jgi:tetratricopeptide (TPR) repeat protein